MPRARYSVIGIVVFLSVFAGASAAPSTAHVFDYLSDNSASFVASPSAEDALFVPADHTVTVQAPTHFGDVIVEGVLKVEASCSFQTLTTKPGAHVIQGRDHDLVFKGDVDLAPGTFQKDSGRGRFRLVGNLVLSAHDQNLGNVVIGASPDTVTLGSGFQADSVTVNNGDTLSTKGYNVTNTGTFVIVGTGTVDATDTGLGTSGTGSLLSVAGDWVMDPGSHFTMGGSTLVFNGTSLQHITPQGNSFATVIDSNTSGGLVFWSSFSAVNFQAQSLPSATTMYFNAGSTVTVSGSLSLAGSAGHFVILRSTQTGAQWQLNLLSGATQSVTFVDTEDSDARPGQTILANNGTSVNSSNNLNWNFGCGLLTSVASSSWSLTTTWDAGFVPTSCNPVLIGTTTVVTLDISSATASTTTIYGYLRASRVNSSTFTLVGGNLIVNAGGTLDLGTQTSPINASSATLILAYGSTAGQYGLIVNAGGNFLVYGAAKTPWTLLSTSQVGPGAPGTFVVNDDTGWQVGDTITIDTEAVTIATLPSANHIMINQSLAFAHYSTFPVIVANLSRNVVVWSSGTDVGESDAGNSAYIKNLAGNTTSFSLNYGDFNYLGADNVAYGIDFESAGSISSCTVRNSESGVFINSSNITVIGNNLFNNWGYGLGLGGPNNQVTSNVIYATQDSNSIGLGLGINEGSGSGNNLYTSNYIFSNYDAGFAVGGGFDTVVGNHFYLHTFGNLNDGVWINGASNVTFFANSIYANVTGIVAGANNIIIGDSFYSNTYDAIRIEDVNNVCANCHIGYSSASVASPDGSAEVSLDGLTPGESLVLKNSLLNPSPGVDRSGFSTVGSYLLNYSTTPGVTQVYGNYQISGSTFTLDYSTNSYASTTLNLKVMQGSEGTGNFTVNWTSDTYAVSQVVTLTATDATHWQVSGSSTPGTVTIANSGSGNWPSTHPQVNITIGGATAVAGDRADFALLAAANDAGQSKKLSVGASSSTFNNGRSKIEIDSTGGFVLKGISGTASTMDMLSGGGTYYTFVDSGAFTVSYSTITNVDENGVWLNGNAGVSIASATFDDAGTGLSSTSTLITVNSLVSTITVNNVTWGNSRTNAKNYNVSVAGSDAGVQWTMTNFTGALTGHANTRNDPHNKIIWGAGTPNTCQTVNSQATGNWSNTLTWDTGFIPTNCNAVNIVVGTTVTIDIANATASSTTINGQLSFARSGDNEFTMVGGSMSVNAGGTLDMGTSGSPIPSGTTAYLMLAYGATAGQYGLVVNPGGNFLVYGAAKTPWVWAAGPLFVTNQSVDIHGANTLGWSVGDTITIDTEAVVITSIFPGTLDFTPGVALNHPLPVMVANLTHNVVVRSSGTDVGVSDAGNSAYIENLVANTANFNVNYGDFQYIGSGGINFVNANGSISSSTFRYGDKGFGATNSSNNAFVSNVVYANATQGIDLDTVSNNRVLSNVTYANGYPNGGNGIIISGGNNTIASNISFFNRYDGIASQDSNDLMTSNLADNNGGAGIELIGGNNNTLISNSVYANFDGGLANDGGSTGNVCVSCNIGYSSSSVASPDSSQPEISFDNSSVNQLVLKNSPVNPTSGIFLPTSIPASSLVIYSTNTGVVQVYGDYQVSSSTLTLDYANQLYASTATTPMDMSGHGTTAIVTPNDAYAVSQLVTATYNGATWDVYGSSTGVIRSAVGAGSPVDCPSSNKEFTITITNGSPAPGDVLNFGLIAASNDAGAQKKLQFAANTGAGFNNDRSLIEISSNAGFHAVGAANAPTLIDRLNSAYYTFVDSGAFTVAYASFTNMDESGIQLNGSGPIQISSASFDLSGSGIISTSTLLTLNGVTNSTITLTNVTYGQSRLNTYNYNYNILGSSVGLSWTNQNYLGVLSGAANSEDDPTQQHILWGASSTSIPGGNVSSGTWYNCAWGYRMGITLNHNQVANSDQTNFPVLVNVRLADLKFTGDGGHVGLSTGTDILFTDANGTKLSHELESYNPVTGQVIAWVKVSTLSHTTDTPLFMYYGNAAASDQQNKAGVWDSNYAGIWHLPDGSTLSAKDSTPNGNNGTISGPLAATGQIDGAASFNAGADYIDAGTGSSLDIAGDMTVSAWINPRSFGSGNKGRIIDRNNGGVGYFLFTDNSNTTAGLTFGNLNTFCAGAANSIVLNTWQYVTAVYSSSLSSVTYFVNGVSQGGCSFGGLVNTSQNFYIGNRPGLDRSFDGIIDEVRVSSAMRSTDWITTEYNNQSTPGAFYSLSGEASASSVIASTATGNWSAPATWTGNQVPTQCNPVNVVVGTTVTIDIPTAMASTTTIVGQLSFARSGDNEFTMVGGSLSVNAGGTLDMGTAGSPITSGTTAYLVLAYGQTAGQYGLVVNPGGNFLVYGAAKTPWTLATANVASGAGIVSLPTTTAFNWNVGDTVTIDTEAVTITQVNVNDIHFSPNTTIAHSTNTQVVVANLTRSVVVRSSGTNTGTNTAYIENLSTKTTSFNLNYGDFQYLGANVATQYGIDFESAKGTISSSTIRYGYDGIYLDNTSNNSLAANNVCAVVASGIYVYGGGNNFLTTNNVYDTDTGLTAYPNGILIYQSDGNTLYANNQFGNLADNGGATAGISVNASNHTLLVSNNSYQNAGSGTGISNGSKGTVFIAQNSYTNAFAAFALDNGGNGGTVCASCKFGYSSQGISLADNSEVNSDGDSASNIVLKNSWVNAAGGGIDATRFTSAGTYLLNYSTTTGLMQIYGDYQVSGSTMTLDYANELYASTATTPVDMSGHGSTALTTPNDAYAVSQLVIATYNGATWDITGSSTGVIRSAVGAGSPVDCPSSNKEFTITITNGSPATGDVLNFGLIAVSKDAGVQKQLQFAAITGSGLNHDRSELEIAQGGGFDAEGIVSSPTYITMMASGGTYYTFVDSGAFTVNYASFTFMDESGIHLLNSGPFSIMNSTFDYSGSGIGSTSTLFTLQNVTNSTITVYGVTYSSTSDAAAHKFNYNIIGSSTGLSWTQQAYTGTLVGANNTQDDTTQKHILWEPVGCSTLTSITNGNWSSTNTWDSGEVPTSCNPVYVISGTTVTLDINNAVSSTITITGQLSFKRSGDNELTQKGGNLYVNTGGTLDMGTQGNPITLGTTAYLILAYGQTAGQYGLVVNPGGNFLVYGAAKTPWTLLSTSQVGPGAAGTFVVNDDSGWQVGDTITIDTEAVTIASLPSSNHVTVNQSLAFAHYSTFPVVVANLSRNVVVRSSGTDVGVGDAGNSASFLDLVTNTTSFSLSYGDFNYLGGIDLQGANASISSCTVRNGWPGISINSSNNNTITSNNLFNNYLAGVSFYGGSQNRVTSNLAYASQWDTNYGNGIEGSYEGPNLIQFNYVFDNYTWGIYLAGGGNDTLFSNNVYGNGFANTTAGINLNSASGELTVANNIYANGGVGVNYAPTSIADNFYANAGGAVSGGGGIGSVIANDHLGYSSASVSAPDVGGEITWGSGGGQLIIQNSLINPSAGIPASNFTQDGTYVVNYTTNPGVAQVYGDYQVSGSTFTLDYSTNSYASQATAPQLLWGLGGNHTATVNSTSDANAVSQLITITYSGGQWVVTGSSTTGVLCNPVNGTPIDCGSPAQFNLTLNNGGTPLAGDMLDFGLMASAHDANQPKKLYVAASSSTYNNGRSKIEVDSTGGFVLKGISGTASTMGMLSGGGTYYTFVDSGAFTVSYSTITNVDENGVWLNGNAGVSIASATFDDSGTGLSSTSTLITVNSLVSTITVNNVTWGNSRTNAKNYNVSVAGSDAGVQWTMTNFTGALTGHANTRNDPNNKIIWGGGAQPILYWISNLASNWNNPNNWSATSGGPSAQAVPSSITAVIFDGNGLGNCTIDTAVNVSSITISTSAGSGFTGVVDTSSNTIILSTFTLNNGTFDARTSTITVNGPLTLSSGTFNANSSSMTVFGLVSQGTATFNLGGSTVTLQSSWTITSPIAVVPLIGNSSLMIWNGPGTFDASLLSAVTVNLHSVTVPATYAAKGPFNMHGVLNVPMGAVLTEGASGVIYAYAGSTVTLNGTLTGDGALVSFGTALSAGGVLNTAVRYQNGTVGTIAPRVYGGLVLLETANSTSYAVTLSPGLYTFNGGLELHGYAGNNATLTVDGVTNAPTVLATSLAEVENSTATFILNTAGNWSFSSLVNWSTWTWNAGSTALTLSSSVVIGMPAIFNAQASSITITGDLTNNGLFTDGTSTVTFVGAAGSTSTLTGSTTFYNVIVTQPGKWIDFAAGSTTTVQGSLTLTGASGNLIGVRSTQNGQQAYLTDTGTNTLTFVDAQDNNASGGLTIRAGVNSHDSGNNVNWTFGCGPINSQATGAWSNTATWDLGIVPTACNAVTIVLGTTVTVDVIPLVSTLTVNAGGALDLNGFALGASSFTVGGNFVFKGTETVSSAPATLSGSTVTYNSAGASIILSTWTYHNLLINGAGGVFTAVGNLTIDESFTTQAGGFVQGTNNDLTLYGNLTLAPGTFTKDAGTGKVYLKGASVLDTKAQNLGTVAVGP